MKTAKIYIQLSAGRGPAECAWVVAQLLKTLLQALKTHELSCEVISRNLGQEPGTLNSCLLSVTGNDALKVARPWEGTIQWIGKSPFRKFHKRKNWFVGVSVFHETNEYAFKDQDLELSTYKASGPGGQHRNKVETAVRVLHRPSGITVTASESRSQLQNKKEAMAKIRQSFGQYKLELMQKRLDEQWKEHLALQRGNPVKVFEGRDFKTKRGK